MRHFSWLRRVAVGLLLLSSRSLAQDVWQADYLSPADLGISKYVFAVEPPKGSVAVLREDEYLDNRLVKHQEVISNSPGKTHVETVLFLDWRVIRGEHRYSIRAQNLARDLDLDSVSILSSERHEKPAFLKVVFDAKTNGIAAARTFLFTLVAEKYPEVKKREPKLPMDMAHPWTYASEPRAAAQ
jgi:hypothetical protein